MNLGDRYTPSSYRKIFGDSVRFSVSSTRMSRASPGLRSVAAPHNSAPPFNMYRRVGRSSTAFSLVPSDSLDLTQTSVVNNEFKVIRTNEKEQLQVGDTLRSKWFIFHGWFLKKGLLSADLDDCCLMVFIYLQKNKQLKYSFKKKNPKEV